jgi:hypothetical protein
MQEIEGNKDNAKFKEGNEVDFRDKIRAKETQIFTLNRQEERASTDLKNSMEAGVKFAKFVEEETDETKLLETINNVKNSSIINSDEFKTLYNKFDTMDGISQLAFAMIIQSSVILSCVFTLIFNIYGGYILDRFQLETRYPKIA